MNDWKFLSFCFSQFNPIPIPFSLTWRLRTFESTQQWPSNFNTQKKKHQTPVNNITITTTFSSTTLLQSSAPLSKSSLLCIAASEFRPPYVFSTKSQRGDDTTVATTTSSKKEPPQHTRKPTTNHHKPLSRRNDNKSRSFSRIWKLEITPLPRIKKKKKQIHPNNQRPTSPSTPTKILFSLCLSDVNHHVTNVVIIEVKMNF